MAKIFWIEVTFLEDTRFHTIYLFGRLCFSHHVITKILRAIIVHKGLLKISFKSQNLP